MLSTTEDLAEAIIKEMESIRSNVTTWGLDPLGIDRTLYLVQLFDVSCAKLLAESRNGQDHRDGLIVLLAKLSGIKSAIELGFKQAKEAECLADYAINAEAEFCLKTNTAPPALLS
jgi:hypothetical protein